MAHPTDPELKQALRSRLAKIAGQVAGIQRMVEDDRYCVDVLLQIAAVRSALAKAAERILDNHIDTCVADAFRSGSDRDRRDKAKEVFDVLGRFGRL